MIQWIHKNKRSLAVFMILSAIVLSMSLFGVDIAANAPQRSAITINDHEISFQEFQNERNKRQRLMIEQYRRLLGDNFNQFARNLNVPNSQVVDALIAETLVTAEARRFGFRTGEEQLRNVIRRDIFGGSFDPQLYSAYLAQLGVSSRTFEEDLRKDLVMQQYRDLLRDMSVPSKAEIESVTRREETKYTIDFVEIDPAAYQEKAGSFSDEEIKSYYERHQTDFEIAPQVTYNYIVFDPETFASKVEIAEDEIEFVYSDNESKYTLPEKVRAAHIVIKVPDGAAEEMLQEIKRRAEEAYAKAAAGEDFAGLATLYSNDFATSLKGGDLGWITRGTFDKRFDDAVFGLQKAGMAPLIERADSYEIVKVEEYQPSQPKPLEEVRAEIEAEIRKVEAPAYSSAAAQELYDEWLSGEKNIAQIAEKVELAVEASGDLVESGSDPSPQLKGLTAKVIKNAEQGRQLIELQDRTVLVEISKFNEPKLAPLDDVRDKIVTALQKQRADELAQADAEKILAVLQSMPSKGLKSAAAGLNLKVQQQGEIGRRSPPTGVLGGNQELIEDIVSAVQVPSDVGRFYKNQGKYVVAQVVSITPPSPETIKEKLDTYRAQAEQESAQIAFESALNRLKASSEIDVDPGILAEGGDV
ncbi:MAG: SurA N-terminal domain-containing protein [Deltaproteobacteria bacterium]|nr:SurA N-terminal domain-containing protein [Deltaproteobacteria bacterium]